MFTVHEVLRLISRAPGDEIKCEHFFKDTGDSKTDGLWDLTTFYLRMTVAVEMPFETLRFKALSDTVANVRSWRVACH